MKVLWFSHINLIKDVNGNYLYPGGNWIVTLKDLLINDKNIELGIAFFGEKESFFIDNDHVSTFQIAQSKSNKLQNLSNRLCHSIESQDHQDKLLNVINKFQPDIIQVFGTEGVFGLLGNEVSIPIIIHIQGLLNPCLNAWMFPGSNHLKIALNSKFSYFIRGVGLFHDYFRFRKKALRELEIFQCTNYYIGRTYWDMQIVKLCSPDSHYFHCDEILRDGFYNTKWIQPNQSRFTLSSTINSDIYKGLDVILKTAILLKTYSDLNFEWNIFGLSHDCEYVKLVEDIVGKKLIDNNIRLKGVVNEVELINGLLVSNVFVHCSYIDNSPNSICEAQLIGLPVISSNVGGVSSLIENNKTGILIPANDPYSFATSILKLKQKPEESLRISLSSRTVAHARHDKSKISKTLIEIYQEVIHESNNSRH